MTYNRFMQGLKAAGIEVDRKILADLAVNDAPAFATLVELSRADAAGRGERPTERRRLSSDSLQRTPSAGTPRADQPPIRSGQGGAGTPARSVRSRTGRFAVEGPQAVREAVRYAAARVRDVYLTAEALARYAGDIVEPARAAGLWCTR